MTDSRCDANARRSFAVGVALGRFARTPRGIEYGMRCFTAIATVRSRPPRGVDELRSLLVGIVAEEPTIDPAQAQVTLVFNSDKHVLGLKVLAGSEQEAQSVLERVRTRLEADGVISVRRQWRLLEPLRDRTDA